MTLTGRPALLVGTLTSSPAHLLQQRSASTGQVYDAQSSPKNSRMPFRMQVERLINSHIPRGKTDRLSRSVMRFLTDRGGKCSILPPKHHAGTNQINFPQTPLPRATRPARCPKARMLGGPPP